MARGRSATRDDARKKARDRNKNAGSGGGVSTVNLPSGVDFFKLREDRNLLEVIPFTSTRSHILEKPEVEKGEIWWRLRYKIHRNVGPNNETVVCPTTFGKPCPICEERGQLFDEKRKDEAKKLFPSWRSLMILRSRDEKEAVSVLDISEFAYLDQLKGDMRDAEDDGLEDVDTFYWPSGPGYNLQCRFEETSFGEGRSYLKCTRVDLKPRKALDDKIIKIAEAVELQETLVLLSYEVIRAKFLGMDPPDEEEEREKPRRERREAPDKEPDPEPEKDEGGDDLDDLDEDALLDKIDEMGIEVSPKKLRKMDENDLRELIRSNAGVGKDEEPEPEPEKEEKKPPKKDPPKPKKEGKKEAKGKCPHGHKYGVDTDEKDDCSECDVWGDCIDEKEGKG